MTDAEANAALRLADIALSEPLEKAPADSLAKGVIELALDVKALHADRAERVRSATVGRNTVERVHQALGDYGIPGEDLWDAVARLRREAQEAAAREAVLTQALRRVADDPHQAYTDPNAPADPPETRQYKIGVADGHRCAASIARLPLAAPSPAASALLRVVEATRAVRASAGVEGLGKPSLRDMGSLDAALSALDAATERP